MTKDKAIAAMQKRVASSLRSVMQSILDDNPILPGHLGDAMAGGLTMENIADDVVAFEKVRSQRNQNEPSESE